jgi:predicted TIM-barrel fold metal-dependent hydrolase
MLIDSHCHIFTNQIVKNVSSRSALVDLLKLNVEYAGHCLDPKVLETSAARNKIDFCVLLPTAAPNKVRAENDRHFKIASKSPRLRSLGTLHPTMNGLSEEISRVFDLGIIGFKLSSFSQRFDLVSSDVEVMLSALEKCGSDRRIRRPVVVFDTFTRADIHFGADYEHVTIPSKLAEIVRRHPDINFVGSHMGGLAADFKELLRHLVPMANLYLDTSNAAHTLTRIQFIDLLKIHGPNHILFGTDWPWFEHSGEIPVIRGLLEEAGYSRSEQEAVFGENARKLFGF